MMSDFRDFYLDDDKCPKCGTEATYELSPNSFACKCTYEAEIRQNNNENVTVLTETNQHEHAENDTKVIDFDNKSTESA
jgi:uncharacterized Zn ribbon protein